MNNQPPNHAGMSGYGLTPQQQNMIQQQQHYQRMLAQHQQQQHQGQHNTQQHQGYTQAQNNFYQQEYMQLQAQALLQNQHMNAQQMLAPQQSPISQQFYNPASQFQQIAQNNSHAQNSMQYNTQNMYQAPQQSHMIPPQNQEDTMSHHIRQPQGGHHQSAFTQPQHSHAHSHAHNHPSVSQHYYDQQQQPSQQAGDYAYEQSVHHSYSSQPHHHVQQQLHDHHQMRQNQQQPQQHVQQQQVKQKPEKLSAAKEAENSAAHNELIRKQRIEEEQKKLMERDRRETERVQGELQTKEANANRYAQDVQERLNQFKYPLTLAACHLSTNLTRILPVPQASPQGGSDLPCYNPDACEQLLNSEDPGLAEYMSGLLLNCFEEVSKIQTRTSEIEANIYNSDDLPPLMRNVHTSNQYSLHIQSEFDDMTLDPELAQAVAEVAAQGGVADILQLDDIAPENLPSTSNETRLGPVAPPETSAVSGGLVGGHNEELRKQIVSLGKQPKGKGSAPPRRKRDMVGELLDSLTPYYDVSTDRRGRRRARDGDRQGSISDEENVPEETGDAKDGPRFFQKARRTKKKSDEEPERPPTPTEVIQQRDIEWAERQKNRSDKLRRRQMQAEAEGWMHDAMAESESQIKVENIMEQIFDQVGGFDVLNSSTDLASLEDYIIDRSILELLRQETQKLKIWRKLHKVSSDRLGKLVLLLEKNIRDVINEEGQLMCTDVLEDDDVGNETARELIHDRLIRASEAASVSLVIMTSYKIGKQCLAEDTMERATQLCKQLLKHVIYPAADSIVRNSKARKEEKVKKRRTGGDLFTAWIQTVYFRVVEMVECFSELIRSQSINDVIAAQLSTMVTAPFFVDGIGEVQLTSIQLLSIIFRKYDSLRSGIIQELLLSVHQLPSSKNVKNCYRLSNTESIHNFTVLLLQLVQSVVLIPSMKQGDEDEDTRPTENEDNAIVGCFNEARSVACTFLRAFLMKCTAKAEEDYRKRFESFLHDLLAALYRPEWPAAELMLTVVGNLLVQTFRNNKNELSLRTASLDYLGTITARLRKDRVNALKDASAQFEKARLDIVVKGILYEEADDPTKLLEDIDTGSLSSTEKFQKLQQALIDYLIATKSDNDVSAEYAIAFYAGEWYKKTVDDLNAARERHEGVLKEADVSSRDLKKEEKRLNRIVNNCESMKTFLIRLADKKSLKKRSNYVAKTGNYLIDSDAFWVVKYLASKREFSQSFDTYLKHIVIGIQYESAVGLRTKATKCLTQIIEADSEVLAMPDVHAAVHSRMMDMNAAVREATIELLGKYLVSRSDLFENYYSVLNDRIMDTGVAVRKRVIRIFRDYIEKCPESEKCPEILSKIVRRVSDEEGVKKLALDVLVSIWFVPMNDRDQDTMVKKVILLVDTVSLSLLDNKGDFVEYFLTTILKKDEIERSVLVACRQIVDTLVDYVLNLDAKIASTDNGGSMTDPEKVEQEKKHQGRLLATLTTLSILSKVKPEMMVRHAEVFLPYLSMSVQTPTELQVLNQVISMLERIIPLIDHPSDSFLKTIDEKLCAIIRDKGMVLIQAAVACLGGVCKRWSRIHSTISKIFLHYIAFLNSVTKEMGHHAAQIPPKKRPTLLRCLFSIGPMARYFDFDVIVDEKEAPEDHDRRKIGMYADAVYNALFFFSRSKDPDVNKRSVASLGHVCAAYPEFFERTDFRNMYQAILSSEEGSFRNLKVEILKNLNLFLTVEEERMVKASEEYRKLRDAGQLDDDLNNTDTRGSTNSAVIQVFWKHVLASYFNVDDEVRLASSQVVYQTMMQGLVTPGDPLPTMIAMTTDALPAIRGKIETLLKEIDSKYNGMVASKATLGIRFSFKVQRRLCARKDDPHRLLRGFRAVEHCAKSQLDDTGLPKTSTEAVALLSALYSCLRTNRQQRRSFISSVVRLFSDDVRSQDKLTLEEFIFIADNLATFPFQVMDEPLFLIHTADAIISLSGQTVLTTFKMMLTPKSGELLDEDTEFIPENLYCRLPEDKTQIHELMKTSQACFLLLYIKTYLKKVYKLTDAKVSAYSPSEPAKVYEKAITRSTVPIFRPELTLNELRPEVIAKRNTVEGHIELCHQMNYFRNMFYSLDIHDDGGSDEEKECEEAAAEPSNKRRRMDDEEDDE